MQLNTYKEERELDARVAEKVLGIEVTWQSNTPYRVVKDHDEVMEGDEIANYSSNIGSAMQIALELRRQGFVVEIRMDNDGMSIAIWDQDNVELVRHDHIISKFAAYMCHAALVAVGEERRMGADRRAERKSVIR